MRYEEIAHHSPDYHAACTLRDRILRQPIHRRLSPDDVAGEDSQYHFIARDDTGAVVGTVLFKPLGPTHSKLRQMAIAAHLHGQGIGAELVRFAEAEMRKKGTHTIETHARHYAMGFYEKLGYTPEGALFEEVGLPTIRMRKSLS